MEPILRDKRLYFVGGCVRDQLMGVEPHDIDYCFEGSAKELLKLFPDALLVGDDFPVYLVDGNEIALTRTEKSTGNGYNDFEVDKVGVSIVEDLERRDFTMNQIAINTYTGEFVDPTNGRDDIRNKTIRTTNPNAFIEDPVRILRGVRFCSTMGFDIDMDTCLLMGQAMIGLKHVTRERITLELEKVWKGSKVPSRFFYTLAALDGVHHISPVLEAMQYVPAGPFQYHGNNTVFQHTMNVIDAIKRKDGSFSAFMGGLVHDFGKTVTPAEILPSHHAHEYNGLPLVEEFIKNNRFDTYTNQFMMVATKQHMKAHRIEKMKPVKLVRFAKSIPKNMIEDFKVVHRSDHEPSAPCKAKMDNLFEVVNSHRMTPQDVDKINRSTDKKQTAENILVNAVKDKI